MPSHSPAASIHLSNALTYGSLFAGVAALAAALQGNAAACGSLLAAAVVFDTFDGRFARHVRGRRSTPNCQAPKGRTDMSAEMGTQLDSLVDAVTFGMLPVACASVLFPGSVPGVLWWAAAFVYVACAVTRLGFYNVSHSETNGFIGLPAPVAALFWSSLFLFEPGGAVLAGLALASAIAMIAPLPVPRPTGAGLALFVLWPVGLIVAHGAHLLA